MKTQNAVAKLQKAGWMVSANANLVTAIKDGVRDMIQIHTQRDNEIGTIKTVRRGESDCVMTDYFPGTYHNNISRAIRFAN